VIAAQRATSGGDGTPSDRVMLLQVLGVWWNLAQGLDSVNALRVADALQYLRRAVYGFALLGDQDQLFEAAVCGLAAEAALQTLRPSNSGLAQLHAQIPSLKVTMIIALGAGLGPVTPDYCAPRPH